MCLWGESEVVEGQTIEWVWFAGVHSDIGGWYEERGLSNIALHWVLEKAAARGLKVDRAGLASRRPEPLDREGKERFVGRYEDASELGLEAVEGVPLRPLLSRLQRMARKLP